MAYQQRKAFLRQHSAVPPVPTVALATFTARAGLFLESTRKELARADVEVQQIATDLAPERVLLELLARREAA